MRNNTTLVVGDPHSIANDPDQGRFKLLGNLITDLLPDNIVQIGDFLTYDSISSHNNSKRLTMEGMRLRDEMISAQTSYNLLMRGVHNVNDARRSNRKALYKPNLFWLDGNHEDRAQRYCEENPELAGVVDYHNYFSPRDDGWVEVGYREHCEINGCLFTHIPMAGNNQPRSSIHLAKLVLRDYSCSVVYGHTHCLAYESEGIKTAHGHKRTTSLNVGCYFSHSPEYARTSKGFRNWWAGVCILHHLNDVGDYDLETLSLDRLRQTYPC